MRCVLFEEGAFGDGMEKFKEVECRYDLGFAAGLFRRYAIAPDGNEVLESMQGGCGNPRAAAREVARFRASKSRPIRRITLRFQPLVIFGPRGKNRLQRQLTRVYSHLTDWDPGELVEIRWNRNISSGRAAAHSSVIEQSPLPILPVSRPHAATEQRHRRSHPPPAPY